MIMKFIFIHSCVTEEEPRKEALIKMSSSRLRSVGQCLLCFHTDVRWHWHICAHINIEIRIMPKSLHGDYVCSPFLLLAQTALTTCTLLMSFTRWCCQLIQVQVLHKGDPLCLVAELSLIVSLVLSVHSFSPFQLYCYPLSLFSYLS